MFSFLFQAKFGFGWAHPLDFFSFRLISTHDYIMCYLILVVTLVSWLLFIIIKYFFWGSFNISTTYVGKFRYYLMGGFNNDLYLWGFKYWLFIFYWSFTDFVIFWLNYYFFFFFLKESSSILRDSKILSHFIVRKKFKKLQVRFIFFFAGPRCFIRGYFLDSKDIFFKYFTYRFLDIMRFGFVEYKLVFDMQESFIQSRINGLAFFTTDGCEKFYSLQKWRHSFYLELFWAIAPSVIIMLILGPSLVLLYSSGALKFSDFNIIVNANQWYWNYFSNVTGSSVYENFSLMAKVKNALKLPVYSINFYMEIFYKFIRFETIFWDYDFDNDYDAYMLEFDSNLPVGLFKRLLDTTQHIKAPAISIIRFLISSTDVLHSFALLSLGTKVDAVTGRLNELVVFLGREGLLFGQCSELCGAGHYGMPIVLESLLDIDFDAAMDNDFWKLTISENVNCPLASVKNESEDDLYALERLINHFAVYKEIDFEDALMFLDNKNNESYGTSINEIMENKANEAGDSIDYDRINRHVMKRLQMRSKGDIQKITESVMEVCKGTLDVPNDPESLRLQAQKEAVFCEKNKAVITESERFFELLKKVRERQKSYFDNEDYIRLSQSYLFDIDICEKDPKSCETDDWISDALRQSHEIRIQYVRLGLATRELIAAYLDLVDSVALEIEDIFYRLILEHYQEILDGEFEWVVRCMVRVLEAYGRVPSDVEGKNEVVSNLRKFFKELSLEFREILAREGKLFDDYEIARKTIYKGIRYEDIDTLVRAYSECNKRNYRNLTKEQMDWFHEYEIFLSKGPRSNLIPPFPGKEGQESKIK